MKNLKHLNDFNFESKLLGPLCIGSLGSEARKEAQKRVRSADVNAEELAIWIFSQVAHKSTGDAAVDEVCGGPLVTLVEIGRFSREELSNFSESYGGRFFGSWQHQDVAEGQPSGVDYLVFQIRETNRAERERHEKFQANVKRLQNDPVVKAIRDAEQRNKFINVPSLGAIQHAMGISRKWEDLQKLNAPFEGLNKRLDGVTGWEALVEGLHRPDSITERFNSILKADLGFASVLKQLQESQSWMSAFEHAKNTYAHQSALDSFTRTQKAFHNVRRHWELPRQLVESVGALSALQEQVGRLTLPTLDWMYAAELVRTLGPQGLQEQLAALGIDENGVLSPELGEDGERRLLSPMQQDFMALLSLIVGVLFFFYQEQMSGKWQANVDSKLDSHTVVLEQQAKQLEALSALVEKALAKETRISSTRFVVLDRAALIYTQPKSGVSVVGKLLPREVATLISEDGKWIEIRYYHWTNREYATGWVLKKYFTRVPPSRQYES